MNFDDESRNPLFIPGQTQVTRGCPACKKDDWTGRNVGGVMTCTCRLCGNQWFGGLPQTPQDPRTPLPPTDPKDVPTVRFERESASQGFQELRRRPDPTQPFRTGAPILPDEGEE